MFTADNTQGFSSADLELMNAALAKLVAEGYEEYSASDIINNNWSPGGNTIESLARIRRGRPNEMQDGRRVNVYLDGVSLARAAELGGGNVSEGIRAALARE